MSDEKKFEYTYSARQQEEIEAIKKKYIPVKEAKMDVLRKLDKSADKKGTIIGILLGVLGTLIMGGGMSLCMVLAGIYMIPGILLGLIGMVFIAMAYPVFKTVTKKQREKIAPQIIALTEELTK